MASGVIRLPKLEDCGFSGSLDELLLRLSRLVAFNGTVLDGGVRFKFKFFVMVVFHNHLNAL